MANQRLCTIQDCGKPHYARGWCVNHYQLARYRKQLVVKNAPVGAAMAFIEEAMRSSTDDCIIWPFGGQSDPLTYPQISIDGRDIRANRYVCMLRHGEAPRGPKSLACHSCGNRKCVNPQHLGWGTHQDNMDDKVRHGRSTRGERNYFARLTEAQAKEIIASPEISVSDFAERFGVRRKTVYMVRWRKTWKYLDAA